MNILETLKHYLQETLKIQVKIHPWKKRKDLPFYLLNSYEFHELTLLNQPAVLMIAKEDCLPTPSVIRKHWEQVEKKSGGICIFVQVTTSAYNRKRLIEQRVPFLVPGKQMYLPELGIDLREHFKILREKSNKPLSPATQAVLIHALIHGTEKRFIPTELAKTLGYTLMTMTRAFHELKSAGIGEILRKGRERWWLFSGSKRELWEQSKLLMRSPIKNRLWIKGTSKNKFKIKAGLSALSHLSNLNPSPLPIYAVSIDFWKTHKKTRMEALPSPEEASFELEIWNYDPNLFSKNSVVDPFSLYLSLEKTEDERIESALEKMISEAHHACLSSASKLYWL